MLSYLILMIYILAFIHLLLYLIYGQKFYSTIFTLLLTFGFIINCTEFIIRWIYTGILPTTTLFDFMLWLSIAFVLTYFIIYAKYRRPLIGLFIIPFVIILNIGCILVPESEPYKLVYSIWRYGHLPFIILGSTLFISSFLSAIMYFIQEKQLKSKNFGFIFKRFPSLDTINKINDTTLKLGFYFFTIGAVLGFFWMIENGVTDTILSSKIIFSILTWVIFGVVLALKWREKLRPRQTALLIIIGFLSMVITYIGVAEFLVR